MCESCADLVQLLHTYENKLINTDLLTTEHVKKTEIESAIAYIQNWPQRQCLCCFREVKNFERFNIIIQSFLLFTLNAISSEILKRKVNPDTTNHDDNEKEKNTENNVVGDTWTVAEVERLILHLSKVFMLNFPLYVAFKQGVHSRLDDISAQEMQSLSQYCDLHDGEIPIFLLRNVYVFCSNNGLGIMYDCFDMPDLLVSTAHAITTVISNVKLWLNYRTIIKLFVPLRNKILQYMCKLEDQDLRSASTRTMADFMWAAIKDPLDSQITLDIDGLALAFKYLTSSTLTMRLAGMAQINSQISLFNEFLTTDTLNEVEQLGQKLGEWLTVHQIISHLFGPNLHVEVLKQSHVVLNFLAVENQITEEHIHLIWQAAQLKHCAKCIYDILPALVKNLAAKPALYLCTLLYRLDPKEHTEQSIYIASALTKLLWSRGVRNSEVNDRIDLRDDILSSQMIGTSSENSLGDSSTDEEPADDASSEGRKSTQDIDCGSEADAPPCEKHRCQSKVVSQANNAEFDMNKMNVTMPDKIPTMSEMVRTNVEALRKLLPALQKISDVKKPFGVDIDNIVSDDEICGASEGEITDLRDSDCSEPNLSVSYLNNANTANPWIDIQTNLMGLIGEGDNEGSCSSPMSIKSDKNMADFGDEDDDSHSDEELHMGDKTIQKMTDTLNRSVSKVQSIARQVEKAKHKTKDDYSNFKRNEVCQPGNTLLWDLLQDDKIGQLVETVAFEAEKALCTLLCYNTDKFIRTKFIEACLKNLANNRSVVISLRLLPKLFGSFQQSRPSDTHQVTMWAEEQHQMMHHFFNNITYYEASLKNEQDCSQIKMADGCLMYTHRTQVQVRLHFLTSVFSSAASPNSFNLSLEQVDILWNWLAHDPECADCLFVWLHNQTRGVDSHALGLESLHYLYNKKIPELKPEGISMVALVFFQQLCTISRMASAELENSSMETALNNVGMNNLWRIALKARNTEVSMAAIQYINTYYLGQQLKLEKEFISQCMAHLKSAAEGLNSEEQQETSLMHVQRGLMLLNTHLDIFRRRYAYHLRRWALEGKEIGINHWMRNEGMGQMIRLLLQPAGMTDKTVLQIHTTDLIGDMKAEIAKWWESLQQKNVRTSDAVAPVLGLLLSEGPLRIITQGQEITSEYDERTLADVGFKDNQMIYVSMSNRVGRRRDVNENPTTLPPPSIDCLPTILLLQPVYFEQLFDLMHVLGEMKVIDPAGAPQPHMKAQLLSRRVWDILTILPTSKEILNAFKECSVTNNADNNETNIEYENLLNPNNLQKFMYSLRIVEGICKDLLLLNSNNKSNESKASIDNVQKLKMDSNSNKELSIDTIDAVGKETEEVQSTSGKEILSSLNWPHVFLKAGGLKHLVNVFLSGVLESTPADGGNEWRSDCLGSLLRILCFLTVTERDSELTVPLLNESLLKLLEPKCTLDRLSKILHDSATTQNINQFRAGIWNRSQIIRFTMNLLVCFFHSSVEARDLIWTTEEYTSWLPRLVLEDPDPAVRRETCAGLYRLYLGNGKYFHKLMGPLLSKLISLLDKAERMNEEVQVQTYNADDNKEPFGPTCRDYFWLLCRLIDTFTSDTVRKDGSTTLDPAIDIDALCRRIASTVMERGYLETRFGSQDDGLIGLLNLMANLIKYDPPFKYTDSALEFITNVFDSLFELPSPQYRYKPKCKWHTTRAAAYDVLVEMCRNASNNYVLLHSKLLEQHSPSSQSSYPWDYWPRDEGRSDCGYVGLTNLGATCYMASCIQHLYMMPDARKAILKIPAKQAQKHATTLLELQRMFVYLLESERKSYDPRSFCRVYQMDHQPLNTGEQKDMAEFFIDLVSKIEEMTPELKHLIKNLFCGTLSNSVVSLDCGHVSRTLEDFCTVRCQVADMRNLQESLAEVTVKDTLEGDNMYTCSQCSTKVRAEKRACFKNLPQILCFNTMRYTFNMLTMQKEKVNTHFSFPMRLDMSEFMEKTLMAEQYQRDAAMESSGNTEGTSKESFTKNHSVNESCEYDLIGVTVHTGTADGGHYYSFIKERNNSLQDRWLLFNDAEVKFFDPSQIAAECFGGEMTSKTYDSQTEKYLDFSFEKTNSAYMLFYERVNPQTLTETTEPLPSTSVNTVENDKIKDDKIELIPIPCLTGTADNEACNSIESEASLTEAVYDSDSKTVVSKSSLPSSKIKNILPLRKELEDWIWLDNQNFLRDKNLFEHSYFNFMWQLCGPIPQTLVQLPNATSTAAQLTVSFFLETFIHAKEKPTMVVWVELLTKQFNSSQEACEWFLSHMAVEPYWPIQVLIQCPNQMVRQMFQRLVMHVIQRLRISHYKFYTEVELDGDGKEVYGNSSCITRFMKSLIGLLENGAKAHLRHLSEFFSLLYEFARMGEEEVLFLLKINVIRSVVDFYLGHKTQDYSDSNSDSDDDSSDEAISVEKSRPVSLDKMITLVAFLVERSRGADLRLQLSTHDYSAIAGGKGFPFIYQQVKDNINPQQTRRLIHALCRCDERLASQIISMLFSSVIKHTELCGPFFELLSLLTESSSGPSGLPCFSQLVLQRVWEAAEYCPQNALDWLAVQAPRNKIAHNWILQSMDNWVEPFLMAHSDTRVRNSAAHLLISLVPSQSFRANFRVPSAHKSPLAAVQRELSDEAKTTLHTIINTLLRLLRAAKTYTEISVHGTSKLTSYFALLSYCMVTKAEKLLLGPYIRVLWELFHPRLSEPSVPAYHNKAALLTFWYTATFDCEENAEIVVSNSDITRNIAFNYILADHDDTDVVQYNRAMLPAYYGLLRLFCEKSRTLTRQLAAHQNLQWAFKNITPHPTQYALAADELFRLMTLFASRHPDACDSEKREVQTFRQTTLSAYLTSLDARVSWATLIAALRILVDNDEDRLYVVLNGGITMCFEALQTLHAMYYEATACHVSGDLQELITELIKLVSALRLSLRDEKRKLQPTVLKGIYETVRRLTTLLNTFNPPEIRNSTLELLKELIRTSGAEVIKILSPILLQSHLNHRDNQIDNAAIPLGPFFPRQGILFPWQTRPKNLPRPPRPMVQMYVPQVTIKRNTDDRDYEEALENFYRPYHDFIDVMLRMAVNTNCLNESLVNLSVLVGIEGANLQFNLFPKFWVGIHNNKTTCKYVELLMNNEYLEEYVDYLFAWERTSFRDPIIIQFMEIYSVKVSSEQLTDTLCNYEEGPYSTFDEIVCFLSALKILMNRKELSDKSKRLMKAKLLKLKEQVVADQMNNEVASPSSKKRKRLDASSSDGESSITGESCKPVNNEESTSGTEKREESDASEDQPGEKRAREDDDSNSNDEYNKFKIEIDKLLDTLNDVQLPGDVETNIPVSTFDWNMPSTSKMTMNR